MGARLIGRKVNDEKDDKPGPTTYFENENVKDCSIGFPKSEHLTFDKQPRQVGADLTRKENGAGDSNKPTNTTAANNRDTKGYSFGTAANKDKDKTEFEQGRMPGPG